MTTCYPRGLSTYTESNTDPGSELFLQVPLVMQGLQKCNRSCAYDVWKLTSLMLSAEKMLQQQVCFFHTSRTTGWDNFIRENFQFVLLGFIQILPSRSQEIMHVTFFLYPSALYLKYFCCSSPVRVEANVFPFFGLSVEMKSGEQDFGSSSYWCFSSLLPGHIWLLKISNNY